MAVDRTPWMIGVSGVEHSANIARTLAYAATGGADGIVSAEDLKVTALPTPGGSVRILPGAAAMVNRYSFDTQESYIGRSPSYTDLAVRPTSSSGARADLIVATVRDPQQRNYADWNASLLNNYNYFRYEVVENVDPGAKHINNRDYPSVALARINLPPNTATITQSMITDVRSMIHTRTDRQVKVITPGVDANMAVSQYADFPSGYVIPFEIPQWATKVIIMTHFTSIQTTGGGSVDSNANFRGRFAGMIDLQSTTLKARQDQRHQHTHTSQFTIPSNIRGLVGNYTVQAQHTAGTGALQADFQTTITYDAHFVEVPV